MLADCKELSYLGPSMLPTFLPGDKLYVRPYRNCSIAIGDVIVFQKGRTEQSIAHRVMSLGRGIMTRGDNNCKRDFWPVDPSRVAGQVISVRRKCQIHEVRGGLPGFLYGKVLHLGLHFKALITKIGSSINTWLTQKKVTFKWSSLNSFLQLTSFKRSFGEEYQLIFGEILIGRLNTQTKQWEMRHPFMMFIDLNDLPITK